MSTTTLTLRQLNRSLLARQLLLERSDLAVLPTLERLVALQAQLARPPYLALWARLANFDPQQLTELVVQRKLVRGTMMRATLFLLRTEDYLAFRGTIQPLLTAELEKDMKGRCAGMDISAVTALAERLLSETPLTFDALRPKLAEQFPGFDKRALSFVARMQLPMIQVPDGSAWGYPGKAAFTPARAWSGKVPKGVPGAPQSVAKAQEALDALIRRYLAAFGPATPADFQNWCGLKGMRDSFERLRPTLHTVQDERGRELFDLPGLPPELFPDGDQPAPVRFLAEFDNAILAHADRQRIVPEAYKPHIYTKNLRVPPSVFVDGFLAGSWSLDVKKTRASLNVTAFATWKRPEKNAVQAEGEALLRFVAPGSKAHEVNISTI